jgi:hypothetical protein
MKRLIISIFVIMVFLATVSPAAFADKGANSYEGYELAFATGSIGGTWYPLAAKMAAIITEELKYPTFVEPGGGTANAIGVQNNMYQLAITYSFTVDWAYNGTEGTEFEGNPHTNLRSVAALYPQIHYGIVWADSGIETVKDIVGKRYSPGPRGFGGETINRMILDYYGITYDDFSRVEFVGSGDAASLMKDRHIDCMMHASAIPWALIEELALLGPGIDLIDMDEDLLKYLNEQNQGIFPYSIPAGFYRGMKKDRTTAAFAQIIAVHKDVPEEVVYNITKTLLNSREALIEVTKSAEAFTAQNAPKGTGVMLHPGAERYYREIGVLD